MSNEVSQTFNLDVEVFEIARSVHRVIRAMHDGECPSCHGVFASEDMRVWQDDLSGPEGAHLAGWQCPSCQFTITDEEARQGIEMFAPIMAKNLAVFETWRSTIAKQIREHT